LRERWQGHLDSTLLRPVLLIDEAQEMNATVLSELRLLGSTRFDSHNILSVVLAGDGQLTHRLSRQELLPLGSRIRTRLLMEYAGRDELRQCLEHLLETAGSRKLMTPELIGTLCDHAAGNYRVMTNMAAELLAVAVRKEYTQLDEKLYLEVFAPPRVAAKPRQRPKVAARR
jgi:type II secretory pathway predicted ATPase ExeA